MGQVILAFVPIKGTIVHPYKIVLLYCSSIIFHFPTHNFLKHLGHIKLKTTFSIGPDETTLCDWQNLVYSKSFSVYGELLKEFWINACMKQNEKSSQIHMCYGKDTKWCMHLV